jgi:flagellar biosynthesis/type III secretory pathway chaperone
METKMIQKFDFLAIKVYFAFIVLYFLFMGLYPVWYLDYDNDAVAEFWHKWQNITIWLIALAVIFLVLLISQKGERRKVEKIFNSARSLLPYALEPILLYCQQIAQVYDDAYASDQDQPNPNVPDLQQKIRQSKLVLLDQLVKQVSSTLEQCIMYAPPEMSDDLSNLLNEIQACHECCQKPFLGLSCDDTAQIATKAPFLDVLKHACKIPFVDDHQDYPTAIATTAYFFDMIRRACKIHGMAENLFPVAKGLEKRFSEEVDLCKQLNKFNLRNQAALQQYFKENDNPSKLVFS